MTIKRWPGHDGFSLVELVIGLGLLLFVLTSGMLMFSHLARGTVAVTQTSKADQTLRYVSEQLRLQTATTFHEMTWEKRQETPNDAKIKVYSTVDPIDPQKGTRRVLLEAEWFEGPQKRTKTLRFDLTRVSARGGGLVKFTFYDAAAKLDYNETIGVGGVKVSAAGIDDKIVNAVSLGDGTCLLSGIKIGTAITITADGSPVRHYFRPTTDHEDPSVFTSKSVETFSVTTEEGVIKNLGSFGLWPPGSVKGSVQDLYGNPLKDAEIILFPKQLEVTDLVMAPEELELKTEADGQFLFTNLIPGKYRIYMRGSKELVAIAYSACDDPLNATCEPSLPMFRVYPSTTPYESPASPPSIFNRATSSNYDTHFQTTYRSYFTGAVRTVRRSGGSFATSEPAMSFVGGYSSKYLKVGVNIVVDNSQIFTAPGVKASLINTYGWRYYKSYYTNYSFPMAFSDTSNTYYSSPMITPRIVLNGTAFNQQFTTATMRGVYSTYEPYTPIMLSTNTSALRYYGLSGEDYFSPAGTGEFKWPILTGSTYTIDALFLEADPSNASGQNGTFANLRGKLLNPDGTDFTATTGKMWYSINNGGRAGLRLRGASDPLNSNLDYYYYTRTAVDGGSGEHRYNMQLSRTVEKANPTDIYAASAYCPYGNIACTSRMAPEIAPDVSRLRFTGSTGFVTAPADFIGTVIAKKKIAPATYQTFSSFIGLSFEVRGGSGWTQVFDSSIVNSDGSFSTSQNATKYTLYEGTSAHRTMTFGLDLEEDITVTSRDIRDGVYLKVNRSSTSTHPGWWDIKSKDSGVRFCPNSDTPPDYIPCSASEPMVIYQVATSGVLCGRVYKADGTTPAEGVHVKLQRTFGTFSSYYDFPDLTVSAVADVESTGTRECPADAGGNNVYHYKFDDVIFVPTEGTNLSLYVNGTLSQEVDAYEGISTPFNDVTLPPIIYEGGPGQGF